MKIYSGLYSVVTMRRIILFLPFLFIVCSCNVSQPNQKESRQKSDNFQKRKYFQEPSYKAQIPDGLYFELNDRAISPLFTVIDHKFNSPFRIATEMSREKFYDTFLKENKFKIYDKGQELGEIKEAKTIQFFEESHLKRSIRLKEYDNDAKIKKDKNILITFPSKWNSTDIILNDLDEDKVREISQIIKNELMPNEMESGLIQHKNSWEKNSLFFKFSDFVTSPPERLLLMIDPNQRQKSSEAAFTELNLILQNGSLLKFKNIQKKIQSNVNAHKIATEMDKYQKDSSEYMLLSRKMLNELFPEIVQFKSPTEYQYSHLENEDKCEVSWVQLADLDDNKVSDFIGECLMTFSFKKSNEDTRTFEKTVFFVIWNQNFKQLEKIEGNEDVVDYTLQWLGLFDFNLDGKLEVLIRKKSYEPFVSKNGVLGDWEELELLNYQKDRWVKVYEEEYVHTYPNENPLGY